MTVTRICPASLTIPSRKLGGYAVVFYCDSGSSLMAAKQTNSPKSTQNTPPMCTVINQEYQFKIKKCLETHYESVQVVERRKYRRRMAVPEFTNASDEGKKVLGDQFLYKDLWYSYRGDAELAESI